ncbi:phage tail tape measure protein [Solirubrobacter phytolaccae]|uniref:Phage tail tape measure protein n=1 Tax=Solirubrobacter phytolaccae TaxID=1404360 RepID=A0A9X3N310_9ACTN|nr:hypothetical protein [Solirubrobacter phytolaccae]MDA0178783.1 phage tail tape measure protein [Solirubrobacter phytolaccae]
MTDPTTTQYPPVTVNNQLAGSITVYDSFDDDPGANGQEAMLGTQTLLATVPGGGSSGSLTPLHGPISAYLVYDANNAPVAREVAMGLAASTFAVTSDDVARMATTNGLLDWLAAHPEDPDAQSFQAALKAAQPVPAMTAWFTAHATYSTCTVASYLMAVAARARTANQPPDRATYSLQTLCSLWGGTWPSGLPDVEVSNFACSDANDVFLFSCDIDLTTLPYGLVAGVQSLLPTPPTVHATVQFNHDVGLSALSTVITCTLPTLNLPDSAQLQQPTVSLNITPLFKFVVFEAKATMPFSIFGSPQFSADLSLTVDNVEAAVGAVIDGDGQTLFTPPTMPGVHFDEFGVGMGIFFEPSSFALGLEGKFHLGDGSVNVDLDDDTFVVVCGLDGDVPNPLYVAFSVPQMTLSDVITVFTNSSVDVGIPISISDLSFTWVENPMEPVTLPDGSLTHMQFGFSGALSVLGWSFYGDVELDASTGAQAELTAAPLDLGPLHLTGNGPGVTIRVDSAGNPIPNNQIPKTQADKDAIANATTKQLVPPGGPSLSLTTAGSPYLSLGISVSLLDIVNESLSAEITSTGASFELDFGTILSGTMSCVLVDSGTFNAAFSYGLQLDVPLPNVLGADLGTISIDAGCNATLAVVANAQSVDITASAGFHFQDLDPTVGPFTVAIDISRISDVLSAIEQEIVQDAEQIFASVIADATKWAQWLANGIIAGVASAAAVLRQAFGQSIQDAAQILHDVGTDMNAAASDLASAYSATADAVAGALSTAYGATASEIASALNAAGFGIDEAAQALTNALGTGANDVASALQTAYGATSGALGEALNAAGFGIAQISSALNTALGLAPDAVNTVLQGLGYTTDEIADAFESLGGDFASFGQTLGQALNPSNW